jgi:hypothetical protein
LHISCDHCYFSSSGNDKVKQFTYLPEKKSIIEIFNNRSQRESATEIPANETAFIAFHNIPRGSKFMISQTLSSFNDLEEFTKIMNSFLNGVDSTGLTGSALAPNLKNLVAFLGAFNLNGDSSDIGTAAVSRANANIASGKISSSTAVYLEKSISNSPIEINDSSTVSLVINPGTDTAHGYISQIIPCKDSSAPYQVNISIAIDSVKGVGTLRVGALRRIQLAAGFALMNNPVSQNSIDTSGNGFKVSSVDNRAQAILGVKFYIAKSYLWDGDIIPRYPLRRFSILAAMAVPKIFDNFYLGVGYDLVPGLTITRGTNIYKKTYYQVQNAQIINSSTRYNSAWTHYGVTVNPILFVQFVKLFFK